MNIIDTHIHFDDDRFESDRGSVYANAVNAGISGMVVPATTRERWNKVLSVSTQYPNVYPTAGLHPVFVDHHKEEDLQLLDSTLQTGQYVAIGECGLDGFVKNLNYQRQQHFFNSQIELAIKHKLPLIIHARNAVEDVMLAVKLAGGKITGVVHSYNGSLEQALQLIDHGFYLSFGGAITYDRSTRLRKMIKDIPLNSIMVETDAPDQPVQSHTGERNEPAFLAEVVTTVAQIKNLATEEVVNASNLNATHLFNLPGKE